MRYRSPIGDGMGGQTEGTCQSPRCPRPTCLTGAGPAAARARSSGQKRLLTSGVWTEETK